MTAINLMALSSAATEAKRAADAQVKCIKEAAAV